MTIASIFRASNRMDLEPAEAARSTPSGFAAFIIPFEGERSGNAAMQKAREPNVGSAFRRTNRRRYRASYLRAGIRARWESYVK